MVTWGSSARARGTKSRAERKRDNMATADRQCRCTGRKLAMIGYVLKLAEGRWESERRGAERSGGLIDDC
jgi:hypothetical protein